MIVFINQSCGPLCKDMSLAFADAFDEVELQTGSISVPMTDLPKNLKVTRGIGYNRASGLKRIISWTAFTMQSFFNLLFSTSKGRIWVLVSNPPMVPLVMGWLAIFKRIPFYIVVYDLYPEVLVQTKTLRPDSAIVKMWAGLNRKVFSKAASIFTLSDGMKASVTTYLKDSSPPVEVIQNWADNSRIKPIPSSSNELVNRYNWLGKFVVLYSGNIGATHDLESLIEAARLLQMEDDIHFVIAGDGLNKESLIALAQKHHLSNVEFIPVQSYDDFPLLLAAAAISVVALGNGAEGLSVPSKTYSALASGACLLGISPDESELSQLIKKYDAGQNFIPGSTKAIAEFININRCQSKIHNIFKSNALFAAKDFTPENAGIYADTIIKTSIYKAITLSKLP